MATPAPCGQPAVRALVEAPEQRWADARGRLRYRTVFGNDGTTSQLVLGRCVIEPGDSLAYHSHDATEVYHIVSGRGEVVLDGVTRAVGATDSVYIPGGVAHAARAVGTEPLEFVYVYAADAAVGPATAYTMHELPT